MKRKPLHILVVTNLYPGGAVPQRGVFVENQVDSLRALGHEVELLIIDGARSRAQYLSGAFRLAGRVTKKRFDLVHAHYGLTGMVARTQFRYPLVVSLLGSDLLWDKHRALSMLATKTCDIAIVMSEEMRRVARVNHCVVLPNGTSLELFHPMDPMEARRALAWSPDEFIILWPWDPARGEKNFALAEAAVSRLPAHAHARLVPFFGQLQDRYNLALNAADTSLVTSYQEGSCNTLRESLAVGLPVVSVPVGDAPEMLAGIDLCYLSSPDAEALGQVLTKLYEERARSGGPLRHHGASRVQQFTVEITARKLELVYYRMLEGEREGRQLQKEIDRLTTESLAYDLSQNENVDAEPTAFGR
jgi:glycosyl transferase family 1/glycosyl transferase family 4